MRFQKYIINEKITRREFDTVLSQNEVNCGCEFEFYINNSEIDKLTKKKLEDLWFKAGDEALQFNDDLDEWYKKSDIIKEDLYTIKYELDDKEEEEDNLRDELEKNLDKLNGIKEVLDDLKDEAVNNELNDYQKQRKNELDSEYEQESEKNQKLKKKLKSVENEINELRKKIDELDDELDVELDYKPLPNEDYLEYYLKLLYSLDDIYNGELTEILNIRNFDELFNSWMDNDQVDTPEKLFSASFTDVIENFTQPQDYIDENLMDLDFPYDLYDPGWKVEDDASLSNGGIEVITPIKKINDLVEIIEDVFNWIDKNGYTDKSCGFHVHMSLDPSKYEIDPLKLIMFVEEGKIYEHFQTRIENRYAESIAQGHMSRISPFTIEELRKVAKKEKIEKNLNTEKFLGLHLIELQQNHVEFRYMGGKDYHTKFKQVRNNIVNYAYWLSIACDPDFKKKEYIKKLQKMVDQYNRVFLEETVKELRYQADSRFERYNEMTGISYNKYTRLLDNFLLSHIKNMSSRKPSKQIYNNIHNNIIRAINTNVQKLFKEFAEKVKKVTK